jgi:predicted DNA-binding transcriptional regulator AlpA
MIRQDRPGPFLFSATRRRRETEMPRPTPRATSLERARAAAQASANADQPLQYVSKAEVLKLVPVTYVTVWNWMRAGTFPRSRKVGGKSMWLKHEISAWMLRQPFSTLKGDNT